MEIKYYDTGTKIKELSVIIGGIGSILCIIAGIIIELVFAFDFCGLFLIGGIVSGAVIYLSSWFWYAFGQITDDVQDIKIILMSEDNEIPESSANEIPESSVYEKPISKKEQRDLLTKLAADTKPKDYKYGFWVCKECGEKNDAKDIYCKACGKYK